MSYTKLVLIAEHIYLCVFILFPNIVSTQMKYVKENGRTLQIVAWEKGGKRRKGAEVVPRV